MFVCLRLFVCFAVQVLTGHQAHKHNSRALKGRRQKSLNSPDFRWHRGSLNEPRSTFQRARGSSAVSLNSPTCSSGALRCARSLARSLGSLGHLCIQHCTHCASSPRGGACADVRCQSFSAFPLHSEFCSPLYPQRLASYSIPLGAPCPGVGIKSISIWVYFMEQISKSVPKLNPE